MPIGPGDFVGPYEIVSILGHGGMGVVYLARDRRLQRQVALKFLHPGVTDRSDTRRRVLHEARAASGLSHPNICHVYDVGEHDEGSWIAMEYIDGQPLRALIPQGGLRVDETLRLVRPIAAALAHAHDRGVLHRDLKSANIVVGGDGRPRVLDFGIACRLPETVAQEVTQSATALPQSPLTGTLAYMSPESIRGAAANQRSDLWSLGVLLYEMLTGDLPFSGETAFELASSILHRRRFLRASRRRCPRSSPACCRSGRKRATARRRRCWRRWTSWSTEALPRVRRAGAVPWPSWFCWR